MAQQLKQKNELHPNNLHKNGYDFSSLIKSSPELAKFVIKTIANTDSIDFFNPQAVKALNRALLIYHYGILFWDIPPHYLCPPVPGRADYLHYIAELLPSNKSKNSITVLDTGSGANCIYPILGNRIYDWQFIGSECDATALESAQNILDKNANLGLNKTITLRPQPDQSAVFDNIIQEADYFDITMCNPPFHDSFEAAKESATRKVQNLKNKAVKKPVLNFGGKSNELWCEGGERKFIAQMILESKNYAAKVGWFSTLVSKKDTVNYLLPILQSVKAKKVKTIAMGQGNKISRILVWRF